MQRTPRHALAAVLIALGVAGGSIVAASSSSGETPERAPRSKPAAVAVEFGELERVDGASIELFSFLKASAEASWYEGVERARAAAAAASASSGGGGYAGPHSDAWWQGVAQCEQGGRNDPYFGYFSFMDGSQGGRPWAEQVAAGNATLARAGREVGPWAASCVASGYRASPGG